MKKQKEIRRPSRDLVEKLRTVPTETLSDALDKLGLQGVMEGISPIVQGAALCGPAVTVKEDIGELGTYSLDDFRVGEVIQVAKRNDVIVFDAGGQKVCTWGGLATKAAVTNGIGGVVCDGGIRDIKEIRKLRFPAFARHVVPTSGKTRVRVSSINGVIQCGGIKVAPGDIVVGDETGIVVVPMARANEVLKTTAKLVKAEKRFEELLEEGRTYSDAAHKLLHM